MEIKTDDGQYIIQTWEKVNDGWGITRRTLVKVTHIPTGLSASCDKHLSVHKNKNVALEQLKHDLKVYEKITQATAPEMPHRPAIVDEADVANALDVLKAYPGREASEARLNVWEAMRDSIVNQDDGNEHD